MEYTLLQKLRKHKMATFKLLIRQGWSLRIAERMQPRQGQKVASLVAVRSHLFESRVIMILKPGTNPNDVQSYRPISLLPVIAKILEKLLLTRLLKEAQPSTWIPTHQFGFRKGHSTTQQCHRLTDIINKTFEDRNYCNAVFLDVSQAFDKVWHPGLLAKI